MGKLPSRDEKTAPEGMKLRGGCKGTNREIFRRSPESTAPGCYHRICSLENMELALLDEKPRPMGIKGRGQSGSRRFRIAPWAKAGLAHSYNARGKSIGCE